MFSHTNFCTANIPNEFNDKISSMGGSYTGVCYGYKDENCTGEYVFQITRNN